MPQVAGDRCLARQQAEDPLVDVQVAAVDAVVAVDHHLRQLRVAVETASIAWSRGAIARSAVVERLASSSSELVVELLRSRRTLAPSDAIRTAR